LPRGQYVRPPHDHDSLSRVDCPLGNQLEIKNLGPVVADFTAKPPPAFGRKESARL